MRQLLSLSLVAALAVSFGLSGAQSARAQPAEPRDALAGRLNIQPYHLAIDRHGNVFVADGNGDHVEKLSPGGRLLRRWGGRGTAPGKFNNPAGIAVDSHGDVYVADRDNGRVEKFSGNGRLLAIIGKPGTKIGDFVEPAAVALDRHDDLYVSEESTLISDARIQKFSPRGKVLSHWGTTGNGNGETDGPWGMAIDKQGNIFVAEFDNNRIHVLSPNWKTRTTWVGGCLPGRGHCLGPNDVAVDRNESVYVVDTFNNRIEKFTSAGAPILTWGTQGSGNGQFQDPFGVAVDGKGNVYVADYGNNRIEKFTSTGQFLTAWR